MAETGFAIDSPVGVEAVRQAVGSWELDPAHSTIGFYVRYLKVTKVRGTFTRFAGTAEVAPRPEDSTLDVTIEAASVDTGNEQRDAHLRGPEFFDVERHPALRFVATRLEPTGGNRFRLIGDLTMHGVTNSVELDGEFLGIHRDPWGREKAVVAATATLDRERWGLTWNQALEAGGVLVGKDIHVEVEAQFVRR